MSGIRYVRGDATVPSVKGAKVIAHVCNDLGGWGELGATVHMPRIGCGLAGGKWSRVEPLIEERLIRRGIQATVHDHGD
ncbi:hypothetical protein [Streptomyces coeruleorubidus]|uniref:Macro domain-containing protein n=1 Tax=Streptomyces coeruleorubidus TaxID=116188 RepID=A0A5J6IDN2_STRC4|nr:hypothetical protein [Streptomyces coeruleorubidus]QEV29161.1 hypothetical protein CP976_36970 [Streptomyces coeruleorubidus]GGT73270.1 hypothetical protein GCM10010256_34800 [Streptomyces coeruleorubidus]